MTPTVQELMLGELQAINRRLERMEDRLEQARLDVAALKIKAGLWGAAAGALPAVAILVMRAIGGL